MVKLDAKTPCAGLLPLSIGAIKAEEVSAHLTSLAPFRGQDKPLSTALKAAHGMAVPSANRATGTSAARAIWFGQRMILLMGPEPDVTLAEHVAMTDQSDAWAMVELKGAGAHDVLARLTPIDLRPEVFKTGHTARTDLRHMMTSITRTGEQTFLILVFRGFAETLVHDLRTAMETVSTR